MIQTTNEKKQAVVLVAADTGEFDTEISMEELAELVESAGGEVVASLIQKRSAFDPATVIGAGRLQDVADFCKQSQADMVIFDHELSPSQMRNIEEVCQTAVIDRTALILDIFAQRAITAEGKLQVELAQLQYRLPRLSGLGKALSRLGGGIGTRGPGESQLETDRRHIRRRIEALREQLKDLEKRRGFLHERRKKDGITTVAIVGYTNVGKSTLLNALTDAGVLVEDRLFATLDPTSRALTLPDGRSVMLVDTVGLVRRLPHQLIEAFRSTLEEAVAADLLWCVCDSTSDEVIEQIDVTKQLLMDLGVGDTPILTVMNKCDLIAEIPLTINDMTAMISAKTGFGLDVLLEKTATALTPTHSRVTLLIPYDKSGLINEILQNGKVFSQEYEENGTKIEAMADNKILYKLNDYLI